MKIKAEVNVHDSFYCKGCCHLIFDKTAPAPRCSAFNKWLNESRWDHAIIKCRKCVDACFLAAFNK